MRFLYAIIILSTTQLYGAIQFEQTAGGRVYLVDGKVKLSLTPIVRDYNYKIIKDIPVTVNLGDNTLKWTFSIANEREISQAYIGINLPISQYRNRNITFDDKQYVLDDNIRKKPVSHISGSQTEILTKTFSVRIQSDKKRRFEIYDLSKWNNPVYEIRLYLVSSKTRISGKLEIELQVAYSPVTNKEIAEYRVFQAGEDWLPYSIDWQTTRESVWSFENFLDAPSGKHGFLTVQGTDFVFEDGTPFRMWGVNLSASGCFPTKEEAPKVAAFLARWGFNAVRFSHLEPKWAKGVVDFDNKEKLVLKQDRLDLLFYFIAELRKQGIYYIMDGFHRFEVHTDEFRYLQGNWRSGGLKFLLTFHNQLRQHHEDYLKQLFTTVNPYTGVSMAKDPGLAGIQMLNESFLNNSLRFAESLEMLPSETRLDFLTKWEKWAQENNIVKSYNKISVNIRMKFFSYLERAYFKEQYQFYRKELGLKAPICTTSCYVGAFTVPSALDGDYSEGHAYYGHPKYETINGKSMIQVAEPGYIGNNYWSMIPFLLHQRIGYQPFIVGEWNSCTPERFDIPLLMTGLAGIQNFNGLFFFNLIQSPWKNVRNRNIGTFVSFENPSIMVNMIPAALAYHNKMVPQAKKDLGIVIPYDTVYPKTENIEGQENIGTVLDDQGREIPMVAGKYKTPVFWENKFLFRLFSFPQVDGLKEPPGNIAKLPFLESSAKYYSEDYRKALENCPVRIADNIGTIQTPSFIAVWGRWGTTPVNIGELSVAAVNEQDFSVSAIALDNKPLKESSKILLAVAPTSCAKDIKYLEHYDNGNQRIARFIETLSEKSPVAKPVIAEITFKPGKFKLYKVDNAGIKSIEYPADYCNNSTSWKLDGNNFSWFFLLER